MASEAQAGSTTSTADSPPPQQESKADQGDNQPVAKQTWKRWLPNLGWGVLIVALVGIALWTTSEGWSPLHQPPPGSYPAQITDIKSDGAVLEALTLGSDAHKVVFNVEDKSSQAQLKNKFKKDDIVGIPLAASTLAAFQHWPTPGAGQRWLTLLTMALLVALLAFLILLLAQRGLGALILGADKRYSKSKFQFVLWFWVLLAVFLSTLWLRYRYAGGLDGIKIPSNLLELAGLSGLSMAAAKGITQSKQKAAQSQEATVEAAATEGGTTKKPLASGQSYALAPVATGAGTSTVNEIVKGPAPAELKKPAKGPSWRDLLLNDVGDLDVGDFQMMILTLIAVGIYVWSAYFFLGTLKLGATVELPDVDQSLLALLGVSHVTYNLKKTVTDPTPPKE